MVILEEASQNFLNYARRAIKAPSINYFTRVELLITSDAIGAQKPCVSHVSMLVIRIFLSLRLCEGI